MKNSIKYYYDISPETIHQKNKEYFFAYENKNYALLKYEDQNIKKILSIIKLIEEANQNINQLIPNNKNELITLINNEKYILIKLNINPDKINIHKILFLNSIYNKDLKLNTEKWSQLWSKKIDYLEYQLNQIGKSYQLLVESFSYYIGLAENAISITNLIDHKNITYSVNHKRININSNTFDLYNPLNIIIDVRIRDICEYLKSQFFNNKDILNQTDLFLDNNYLTKEEKNLFFARMLFPTYYFDVYDQIISKVKEEKEIKKILSKNESYEYYLKYLYNKLDEKKELIDIEWIKKI